MDSCWCYVKIMSVIYWQNVCVSNRFCITNSRWCWANYSEPHSSLSRSSRTRNNVERFAVNRGYIVPSMIDIGWLHFPSYSGETRSCGKSWQRRTRFIRFDRIRRVPSFSIKYRETIITRWFNKRYVTDIRDRGAILISLLSAQFSSFQLV